jgi:hypothetical protein
MLSDRTLRYGLELAPAILALDALYRNESGDKDGLAVLNMDSEKKIQPAALSTYPDLRERFVQLKLESANLPEPDRCAFYDQFCGSMLAFIDWREKGLPFAERLARFLHVPAAPASDAELDALQAELRTLLNRMGYNGDLAKQCADWEARNRVPPDEVPGVLEEMFNEAWDRTEERVLPIPAPKSDGMKVKGVNNVAFNARCNYLKRTVELNTDPVLTRPGLKHLAVHECYPGHYLQFKLREVWFKEGRAAADSLFSTVNNASSSVFEGVGDNGLRMLDWYESDDDRVQAILSRYRAGIATAAAWRLHALSWQAEQVRDWLRSHTLVGGEGWVANRMAFISTPSRSVLIWSYWWGEQVVAPAWERVPQSRRREFYVFMYRGLHSVQSIAMFQS